MGWRTHQENDRHAAAARSREERISGANESQFRPPAPMEPVPQEPSTKKQKMRRVYQPEKVREIRVHRGVLKPRRRDCRCRCCCWCCWSCCCSWEVEDNVWCVAFFSLRCHFLPFLPFSPCDPFCLARFPRGSRGCSPHSSTCGPLSIRTHQASLHHVMCLFDTSFPSCIEFPSFLSSTHFSCVVMSSSPSCRSWASTSLSSLRSP